MPDPGISVYGPPDAGDDISHVYVAAAVTPVAAVNCVKGTGVPL